MTDKHRVRSSRRGATAAEAAACTLRPVCDRTRRGRTRHEEARVDGVPGHRRHAVPVGLGRLPGGKGREEKQMQKKCNGTGERMAVARRRRAGTGQPAAMAREYAAGAGACSKKGFSQLLQAAAAPHLLGDGQQGGVLGVRRVGARRRRLLAAPQEARVALQRRLHPRRLARLLLLPPGLLPGGLLRVINGDRGVGSTRQQVSLLHRIQVQAGDPAGVHAADDLALAELQGLQPARHRKEGRAGVEHAGAAAAAAAVWRLQELCRCDARIAIRPHLSRLQVLAARRVPSCCRWKSSDKCDDIWDVARSYGRINNTPEMPANQANLQEERHSWVLLPPAAGAARRWRSKAPPKLPTRGCVPPCRAVCLRY